MMIARVGDSLCVCEKVTLVEGTITVIPRRDAEVTPGPIIPLVVVPPRPREEVVARSRLLEKVEELSRKAKAAKQAFRAMKYASASTPSVHSRRSGTFLFGCLVVRLFGCSVVRWALASFTFPPAFCSSFLRVGVILTSERSPSNLSNPSICYHRHLPLMIMTMATLIYLRNRYHNSSRDA